MAYSESYKVKAVAHTQAMPVHAKQHAAPRRTTYSRPWNQAAFQQRSHSRQQYHHRAQKHSYPIEIKHIDDLPVSHRPPPVKARYMIPKQVPRHSKNALYVPLSEVTGEGHTWVPAFIWMPLASIFFIFTFIYTVMRFVLIGVR
jgi:hypothetical protein